MRRTVLSCVIVGIAAVGLLSSCATDWAEVQTGLESADTIQVGYSITIGRSEPQSANVFGEGQMVYASDSLRDAYAGLQETAISTLQEAYPDKEIVPIDQPYREFASVDGTAIWVNFEVTYVSPSSQSSSMDSGGELSHSVGATFVQDGQFFGQTSHFVLGTGFADLSDDQVQDIEGGEYIDGQVLEEILIGQWAPGDVATLARDAVNRMLSQAADA